MDANTQTSQPDPECFRCHGPIGIDEKDRNAGLCDGCARETGDTVRACESHTLAKAPQFSGDPR